MVLGSLWPQAVAKISPVQQEFQEHQHKKRWLNWKEQEGTHFPEDLFILRVEISLQDDKQFKLSRILLVLKNKVSLWQKMPSGNYPGGKRGSLPLTQAKGRYCGVSSHRSSKIDDNYLKELNEDLKLRKQELLEMLKPQEDKNNLLFQKLMSNLEEKQRR